MIERTDKVKWLSEFTYLCHEIAAMEEAKENIQSHFTRLSRESQAAVGDSHAKSILIFEQAIADSLAAAEEIATAIKNVRDTTLRAVLWNRYIKEMTWQQVALEMNYSIRSVHSLHSKALEQLEIP